ncbi:UNVERIFIED_CONTAM: hypothetical protein FKN15_027006 [Acipenser sinensis]
MMKFRFRRQGNDPQREKIKQDLFAFNKTVEHGFPNQPSALAYDPKLRLMAIGTKSGAVKMMMKFRFRRQGNDPQREKIKQDLFAFNKDAFNLTRNRTDHLPAFIESVTYCRVQASSLECSSVPEASLSPSSFLIVKHTAFINHNGLNCCKELYMYASCFIARFLHPVNCAVPEHPTRPSSTNLQLFFKRF